jgi:hypothetical protein
MTAQEAFEAFVRDEIWPFLKERGFKRSKGTFHRPVGEDWEIINLQKSAYSDADEVRFTINLAVAYKSLTEGGRGWPKGKRPPAHQASVQQRLGLLLGERDAWWEVAADGGTAALADAVLLALERYGVPWLEERSTLEAVFALLANRERLNAEPAHLVSIYKRLADTAGRDDLVAVADERIAAHDEWLRQRRSSQSQPD